MAPNRFFSLGTISPENPETVRLGMSRAKSVRSIVACCLSMGQSSVVSVGLSLLHHVMSARVAGLLRSLSRVSSDDRIDEFLRNGSNA